MLTPCGKHWWQFPVQQQWVFTHKSLVPLRGFMRWPWINLQPCLDWYQFRCDCEIYCARTPLQFMRRKLFHRIHNGICVPWWRMLCCRNLSLEKQTHDHLVWIYFPVWPSPPWVSLGVWLNNMHCQVAWSDLQISRMYMFYGVAKVLQSLSPVPTAACCPQTGGVSQLFPHDPSLKSAEWWAGLPGSTPLNLALQTTRSSWFSNNHCANSQSSAAFVFAKKLTFDGKCSSLCELQVASACSRSAKNHKSAHTRTTPFDGTPLHTTYAQTNIFRNITFQLHVGGTWKVSFWPVKQQIDTRKQKSNQKFFTLNCVKDAALLSTSTITWQIVRHFHLLWPRQVLFSVWFLQRLVSDGGRKKFWTRHKKFHWFHCKMTFCHVKCFLWFCFSKTVWISCGPTSCSSSQSDKNMQVECICGIHWGCAFKFISLKFLGFWRSTFEIIFGFDWIFCEVFGMLAKINGFPGIDLPATRGLRE